MTTFATRTGFNSVSPAMVETATFFELQRGFNGISPNIASTRFFNLQKGFNSASPARTMFRGRVEYPALVPYLGSGVVTVIDVLTEDYYTMSASGGEFVFHAFQNIDGTFRDTAVSFRDGLLRGSIQFSPVDGDIVTIILSQALSIATKSTALSLTRVAETNTNDFLYQGECCYTENVFALPLAEWWKNDKSSFLQKKLTSLDTIEFRLFKNGVEVAILDNDYLGEYYNFTSYTGFVLYWENVYSNYGTGGYQVKAFEVLGGIPVQWDSQEFCLTTYSDEKANGSFRIEAYLQGSIIRSGFNYDETLPSGWYESYRMKGSFGQKQAAIENDFLLTSDRRLLQIQQKVSYSYVLQTGLVPSSVGKVILEVLALANTLTVTDYNLYSPEIFRRVPVVVDSISDTKIFAGNRSVIYELGCKDRTDDLLMRN